MMLHSKENISPSRDLKISLFSGFLFMEDNGDGNIMMVFGFFTILYSRQES